MKPHAANPCVAVGQLSLKYRSLYEVFNFSKAGSRSFSQPPGNRMERVESSGAATGNCEYDQKPLDDD